MPFLIIDNKNALPFAPTAWNYHKSITDTAINGSDAQ